MSIGIRNGYVEPELQPYVNEYKGLLDTYCPSKKYNRTDYFTIRFSKKDAAWIGLCQLDMFGYSIAIDKTYWDRAVDVDRKQLVYHEMAHCLIYKGHIDDPNNYMNPVETVLSEEEYTKQAITDIQGFCK